MIESNKYYKSKYCDNTVIYINEFHVETNNIEYPNGYSLFLIDSDVWVEITEEQYKEKFPF